jgi:hypothetical protein
MNPQHAWLYLGMITVVVACGGSVQKNDGASASAGSSSSAGVGEAGAAARGGSISAGGGATTAGTLSLGGEPTCGAVDCALVDCGEGEVPVLRPGNCCTTCEPRAGGCENVTCEPVEACGEDYELTQPPGACCVGCMPKSVTFCNEIECLVSNCAPGYIPEDRLGGCGCDCVPDPLYCRDDTDCVMADKPRACCGCPEAITWRQYEVEPCWSEVGSPRPLPPACKPEVTCDAICAACPNFGEVADCSEHRCVARAYGLK